MEIENFSSTNIYGPIDLNTISEERLLNLHIRDLPITIEGTWLEGCISELSRELQSKGIVFRPSCYLADEWLTPQNETVIGIPFYLAHPRLTALERKMMLEAEGEGQNWCMKLLRHETGHAICYAYNLHKRKKWQKLFGSPSEDYGDTFRFRPYSKNFVRHLDGNYAQYHPDEDFVETFAVWFTPGLDWRTQYKGWGAFEKLQYVDDLMQEINGQPPLVKNQQKFWRLSTLKITLANYYRKKREYRAEDFPDFHDAGLKKIFAESRLDVQTLPLASDLLEKYHREIVKSVNFYTGEKKYIINQLIKTTQKRCQELKLVAVDPEPVVILRTTSYVTALVMNYLYTGWFRGEKNKRKK
ncbi:MAG: hypothetical protein A2787_03305 [Omnitrophica WOR_2 bacterium RIFCSPHIGHO2_01_FULL_48_9]|nr:MAG: hypothetical protein A2787_03305 [Omnitrophica WOR_2 bacterium RIFCSPHIGHO2_01_FULL_48_9]